MKNKIFWENNFVVVTFCSFDIQVGFGSVPDTKVLNTEEMKQPKLYNVVIDLYVRSGDQLTEIYCYYYRVQI